MKAKPYPLTQNVGGLDVSLDPVYLADSYSPNMSNVMFDKGIIKKDLSWVAFNITQVTGTPMLHYQYKLTSGVIYDVLITTTNFYKYNSSTREWTNIASVALTGDEDDRFSAVTFNDLMVFTNGKDAIQTFDGTTCAALGGSPPSTCRALIVFMNHLIALGTTETGTFYPFRTRWTSAGSETAWSGGTSGSIDLVDTPDWCVAGILLRSKCFVFKQRTIWELNYVGGTAVFSYVLRVDEEGTEAPQSITNLGETVIFFGRGGIYQFDGSRLKNINKKIFPLFYEPSVKILNSTYIDRICATWIKELGQYWLCIPTTTAVPSTLFKLDLENETWTRKNSVAVTAFGKYSISASPIAWSAVVGIWSAQIGTWARKALPSGADTTLASLSTGYTYEDDRSTSSSEEMLYETKDFIFGHAARLTQCRVEATQGPFWLSYSTDGGRTFSSETTFAYVSDWTEFMLPFNITTQRVRFKIRSTASRLEVRWIEPWYIPRDRSATLSLS